jgi:hypothetical protein
LLQINSRKYGRDNSDWVTFHFRLEMAIHLKKGNFREAEKVAHEVREALLASGIASEAQFSSEVYSMLAIAAYLNQDWETGASNAVKYLAKSSDPVLRKLKMFILRCQCYLHSGQYDKLAISARECISFIGRKKMGAFELIYLTAMSKAKKNQDSHELKKILKAVKNEMLEAISKSKIVGLDSDLQLSDWLKSL